MTAIPEVIHFQKWIADHAHLLKPPVNNHTMALGTDFIVQIVGAPTSAPTTTSTRTRSGSTSCAAACTSTS
ncbi:hypothetical protein [Streptomyces sp. ST1015]|uniref:hypothetical protein n=1 Tax=Streptomyces sp. ST1015 TaxID=1848900 RepID=UPI0029314692|nr:hypothetical protein [Streptomyces sp. ST1015]